MSDAGSARVVVVGAGHAGCEAALAAARLGCKVLVITLRRARIAHMPCNCSIGGPAKGQLVREIDALGGQMALAADACFTHIREVGTGRGRAIRTLRAQVDKDLYPAYFGRVLETTAGIRVLEDEVVSVEQTGVAEGLVVRLASGGDVRTPAIVLTSGTFLRGLLHRGDRHWAGARLGEPPVGRISEALARLGVRLQRFKTGTTARVDARTIDWGAAERIDSEPTRPFSFLTDVLTPLYEPLPCWQVRTNRQTHDVVRAHLHRSAMYSGAIKGVGPRYCPSIEDKVVRFDEKDEHPVFLERETWSGHSVYVQGMSTSLPEDAQHEMLRTIPALRDARLLEAGYAVEYDVICPDQLTHTLMVRDVAGLWSAGQLNGTSGYEEAAAQGLIAGANAALYALARPALELPRAESYIGVMIDDLVTKGVDDPYRLLTSRAEMRLHLRHDNVDLRLTPRAVEIGLACPARLRRWKARSSQIACELERLATTRLAAGALGAPAPTTALEALRRPDVQYAMLRAVCPSPVPVPDDVAESVEIAAKYEGYVDRQRRQAQGMLDHAELRIPPDLNYGALTSLSSEAREKLSRIRPADVAQAARVPGVSAADVRTLAVLVKALQGSPEMIEGLQGAPRSRRTVVTRP